MYKTKEERKLETTSFQVEREEGEVTRCFSDLEWWEAAEVIRDWSDEKCEELYEVLRDCYEFIVEAAEQEKYQELSKSSHKNIKENFQDSPYMKCLKMHEKINFLADALRVVGYHSTKVEHGISFEED